MEHATQDILHHYCKSICTNTKIIPSKPEREKESGCTEEWEKWKVGSELERSPPELGVSTFLVLKSGVAPSSNQRPHHLLKGLHALTFWHLYTYKLHLPFFLSGFVSCQVHMQSWASSDHLEKNCTAINSWPSSYILGEGNKISSVPSFSGPHQFFIGVWR